MRDIFLLLQDYNNKQRQKVQTNPVFEPLFMGRQQIHLLEVDSTNAYLSELVAKTSPAEGTAVWADAQTQGRGQLGSQWLSAAGENLTISYLLRPKHLLATQQFCLSQAAALAVYSTLQYAGIDSAATRIKWANDLYVGDEKIAGILIENQLQGYYLQHSIVGIGINVNQTTFPDFARAATSIKKKSEKSYTPAQLIAPLSAFLEQRYLQTKSEQGRQQIAADYIALLYKHQTPALFRLADSPTPFTATIQGIDTQGRLLLRIDDRVEAFGIKEIIFL